MNKELIIDRLNLLIELCEKTEPEIPKTATELVDLFSGHLISAKEIYDRVSTGVSDSENELPAMMKQANKIWRIRNKIKNGELDDLQHAVMVDEIEDFIKQRQKINAIKHYRYTMDKVFNEKVGLRDAKTFVDDLQADMVSRGILKN